MAQVSISPTFYEQLLRQNPFAKKLQTQILSTLKAAQKTFVQKSCLVKLTPGACIIKRITAVIYGFRTKL